MKESHELRIVFKGDSAELVGHSKQVADGFEDIGSASGKSAKGLKNHSTAANKAAQETQGVTRSFNALLPVVTSVASALATNYAINAADDYAILQQRIKTATKETGDYIVVSEQLFNTSQKTGTALASNVELYQRLSLAQKELSATSSDMIKLTKLVNQLGVIGGSTNQQLKDGTLQFSQAMSSAVFRAEEFNSIIENIPELAHRMAKGMNLTKGELRALVLEGKLASQEVFAALLEQSKDINKEFTALAPAVQRASQSMANSLQNLLGSIDEQGGFTTTIAEGFVSLSTTIDEFASNGEKVVALLDSIETAAVATAGVITARLSQAILANISTMIADARATQKAAVSKQGLSAALGMQTTATTRSTAAIAASTVATRTWGAALSFVGGPIGLITGLLFTVGFEMLNYKSATDKATDATRQYAEQLEETTSIYERFISKQKESARQNAKGLGIEEAKARYVELKNEIEKLERAMAAAETRKIALGRRQKIEFDLDTAKAELIELQHLITSFATAPEKAVKSLKGLSDSLASQLLTMNKSRQEARLFNVEQKILVERARLGEQATNAQVISFEKYAAQARDAASALNQLESAELARKELNQGNESSGKIVDFAAERAARLNAEATTLSMTAELRENSHRARMAQVRGHISEESLYRLQQVDLEAQVAKEKYLLEAQLRDQAFQNELLKLQEQETLVTENKALKQQERDQLLFELEVQKEQLFASHRIEKESAIETHEQKVLDIKRRRIELEAQLEEQQRQRDLAGASQFFGQMASLSEVGSKKLFKIGKAFAIAQTIMNTYAAAQRAMAELSYPINIAVAAGAVIQGLVRVKKIKSQNFNSGGSVSAGGSSIGGASGGSNVVPFKPAPNGAEGQALSRHNASNYQRGSGEEFKQEVNIYASGNYDDQKTAEAVANKFNDGSITLNRNARFMDDVVDEVSNRQAANG